MHVCRAARLASAFNRTKPQCCSLPSKRLFSIKFCERPENLSPLPLQLFAVPVTQNHPGPPSSSYFRHMATNLWTDTKPVLSPPARQNKGVFQYRGHSQAWGAGGEQRGRSQWAACVCVCVCVRKATTADNRDQGPNCCWCSLIESRVVTSCKYEPKYYNLGFK